MPEIDGSDLLREWQAAMRSLAGSTVEPFLLAAFPWFVTNPYQALLYGSCREHGITLVTRNDRDFAKIARVLAFDFVPAWP